MCCWLFFFACLLATLLLFCLSRVSLLPYCLCVAVVLAVFPLRFQSTQVMCDPCGVCRGVSFPREPCEALRPVDTFNPVLQRFYTSLAARAMAEGCPLPPLTPLVQK